MTGRRERVENLAKQRAGFEPLRRVFHPSHRPLEIAARFPHAHSPDDDDFSPISLPQQGTLLLPPCRGHFYCLLTPIGPGGDKLLL